MPLILTAELPSDLHRRFTALRRTHYPPERNFVEAHVTLFHSLPPMVEGELMRVLARLCGERAPPAARVEGPMPLGQGTAILLSSPALLDCRKELAGHFHGMLTAQDSHPPRLHVTIQNKVSVAEAHTLQSNLATALLPANFRFHGLALHRYRGGPWEFVRHWPFRGK